MSVYIPGMEMPTSCHECVAGYGGCCFVAPAEADGVCPDHGRADFCPLVPIQPHGRLIDADALGNSLEKLAADKWNQKAAPINWSYAFEECLEMVDNAPTIIEQDFIKAPTTQAEEGE